MPVSTPEISSVLMKAGEELQSKNRLADIESFFDVARDYDTIGIFIYLPLIFYKLN